MMNSQKIHSPKSCIKAVFRNFDLKLRQQKQPEAKVGEKETTPSEFLVLVRGFLLKERQEASNWQGDDLQKLRQDD